jgi:hypothetical protein
MSNSSGFKIVAFVVVISVGAIIVIDRFIDNGAFSSFSFSRANITTPATASQPPEQKDARGQRPAAKRPTPTASASEPTNAEEVPGSPQLSAARPEGPYRVTPGMSRAQLVRLAGNPTLRVIETHNRKVVERFIYIDANRQTRTVAVLENGQTVRSYTERYFGVGSARAE